MNCKVKSLKPLPQSWHSPIGGLTGRLNSPIGGLTGRLNSPIGGVTSRLKFLRFFTGGGGDEAYSRLKRPIGITYKHIAVGIQVKQ